MQEKISEEIRLTTFPFQNKIMYSCELIGYFKDGGDNVREKTISDAFKNVISFNAIS